MTGKGVHIMRNGKGMSCQGIGIRKKASRGGLKGGTFFLREKNRGKERKKEDKKKSFSLKGSFS